jgi:aryl-alcohol dehydrogenase-like predicted oxidoreductase
MNTRPLGNTGLAVSAITLGTVELGIDYGFRGSAHYQKPDRSAAADLLREAAASGITLLDTAPVYGDAEELIGVSGVDTPVATKIVLPADAAQIAASVEQSLRRLRRTRLDLLQLHNPNPVSVRDPALLAGLQAVIDSGKVRCVGASAYDEATALAILDIPLYRTLQVPFNLLDRTMERRVFPLARERGVGILVRSVFLRGVLTARIAEVPAPLAALRDRALAGLGDTPVEALAALALRFCLSFPEIATLILGIRDSAELRSNLAAAAQGPLSADELAHWRPFAVEDDPLVSPLNWQGLI